MFKILLTLAIAAIVAGCATDARIREHQMCSAQGIEKFPVKSVSQNYMETEYFQKQEGMTCIGTNNVLNCEPNMRTYQRQVQKTRQIDANSGSRNSWIEQCANQQCISKFGNAECEPNKKSTASSKPSGVAFLPEMTSGCGRAGHIMGSKEMSSCVYENFRFFNQGYISIEQRFEQLISNKRCHEAEVFLKYLRNPNSFDANNSLKSCQR